MATKPAAHTKPKLGGTRKVQWKDADEIIVPLSQLDGCHQILELDRCGRCSMELRRGDWAFTVPSSTGPQAVGVNCCATAEDASDSRQESMSLVDAEDMDGREFVPLTQVMPYGKTKRDMCPDCFMIPAASGVCGC